MEDYFREDLARRRCSTECSLIKAQGPQLKCREILFGDGAQKCVRAVSIVRRRELCAGKDRINCY